ncbi:hypothetical protein ACJIZ3_023475 [Penstemon smallii]|uniref:Zinc finger C3HC4 RING-type domain-containing protein n=1 Tax=Penstemon smallii TaxID=265156 RepID=A0ABD3TP63_9LAMI
MSTWRSITTLCAHNFCKTCLEGEFVGQSFIKDRTCGWRRMLKAHNNVMKFSCCENDMSDFLKNPQVSRLFFFQRRIDS